MNTFGFLLGIAALFIIGLGFVWVIRGERFFGRLWWPYVIVAGVACIVASLFVSSNYWLSAVLGVFGASLCWGATELKEQAVRGELGWYPFREKKIIPPFAETIRKWKAPSL